jgi:hypothetical protein
MCVLLISFPSKKKKRAKPLVATLEKVLKEFQKGGKKKKKRK